MTREQITKDISALENIRESAIDQSWFGHEIDALTHAIEALRTRLARLDGPPPGHVRATIKADAGPGPGEWYVPRQSESTRPYEGDQSARRSIVVVDLPLPEPAAEVEGEVK